jgi:hypothetical protein
MDHCGRLHSTHHDEHVPDPSLVLIWRCLLVLWQDLQEVDQKL